MNRYMKFVEWIVDNITIDNPEYKEDKNRKCYKLMREAKGSILYPKGKQ